MLGDLSSTSRLDLPYRNLVLTGFLGVGKSTIAREIVRRLAVDFLDVDEEIELRELMSIAKLREVYGDTRLRALEHDLCRQAALMRRAVIVVPGAALLDTRNYDLMHETGIVVCLACELGEALRRMHLGSEQHYRDSTIRRRMLSRLRRERAIVDDPRILQLDTTHLRIEEEAGLLIQLWATGEPEGPLFQMGPRERIKPPPRPPMGLSSQTTATLTRPKSARR
jgi:shikimate kinase